ncbi:MULTISPECIES: tyrosine-type recombinase/integrase [unclassified Leifsonia]|uniref:tyrosine-type recombinase/integrase n=2 Tax=Leifsonia TaxID=110932 RepID=UPI0012FD9ACF|nr:MULTISPECIES: tyrosine-type recombinase/integrase [unclassified Leifsonia]
MHHPAHLTELLSILHYWRVWQESQGLSARTIAERAAVITRLVEFAGVHPLQLSPLAIMAYCSQPGLSDTSRATYHASIRAYCKFLVASDHRADDPSLKTPTPKRPKGKPRPVFDNQLELMLATVNRRRTRTMILLGALAGMRVHEIAKVHGADFDLANEVVTITGKGGSTEMVPLHPDLVREAHQYPRDGYWFPAYASQTDNAHISRQGVYAAIKGVMERAGVQGTPHQLRHWYGTTLLDSGVDVRVVQELMRHKSLDTTAIYTLVNLDKRRAGIERLRLPSAA